ncbi:Zn-dependent hydrolase [Streptomyces longisporoflavus]|uniref:M20/M25/M40 family metallo-hydrolase n=1 Tax=Streptomyces longisporoflavus TaxID=28044 RepID=UPI00167D22EE|nr:M20/M25/M40 family metallo-hydrolase [Streptomyces longisporoflavus]GGV68586.1 Zn-dependent hydrolase [Streptomyces longisporoflavus]
MTIPSINAERLLTDLTYLGQIGAGADGSIYRVAGSTADLAGRDWIDKTMRVAGLHTYRDETGNVFSRRQDSEGPWLLIGSHADTVPGGGYLDGAYGVIAAMEVLRTLHEADHPAAAHLETVAFWDEEGVTPQSNGGLVGSTALSNHPHIQDVHGYLELHVEQGPRMERAGLDLSAVTGIVGVRRFLVQVRGQENHAGTTPFALRADAGRVATRFSAALRDICQGVDEASIGNIGSIALEPDAPNVVPGAAKVQVEIRAGSEKSLDGIEEMLRETLQTIAAEEQCTAQMQTTSAKPVADFDTRLVDAVEEVCLHRSSKAERMLSYAGHDASVMSTRVPTAMIFVPSTGGYSHSNLEHTPDEQLVLGTQALLESVVAVSNIMLTQDVDSEHSLAA